MRAYTLGISDEIEVATIVYDEAFRAGHYKDLTETGNRARKVSGTQGTILAVKAMIS